jgi:hypothetical protein
MPHSRLLATLATATALSLGWSIPAFAAVVAQWNMDNTFGTTMADSSGNGNDGTTYNIVTSGAGYIFNGSSSRAVVPTSATLNPGTSDFSYTVQVQVDIVPDPGTDYDVLRKGTGISTGGEYKLEIVNSNGLAKPKCVVQDSAGHTVSEQGKYTVADGKLHTITCIRTSNSLTLVLDARTPQVTNAPLDGSISTKAPLALGDKQGTLTGAGDDWYNGSMRSASVSVGP